MIIGVDADGVLTDMQAFNYTYGKEFFRKKIVNPEGYSVREIFEISKFAELLYGIKYFPKYCKEWKPRKGASEVINRLLMEGHSVHEITARKFVTSKTILGKYSKSWFETWCQKYHFHFDSITFCSEKKGMVDKYRACMRLKVDLMIDDRPEIVMYLARHEIPVLMMDAPYNQKVRHKNVTRVFGWEEIYQEILQRYKAYN